MSQTSLVDHLFSILDESTTILMNQFDVTYLEALAMTGENIYHEKITQDVPFDIKEKLKGLYDDFFQEGMTDEEVRRAFQLNLLKGMKASTQPHHQMTPDGIVLFMGYLLNKLVAKYETYSILDPAVGTANLLTALMNHSEGEVTGMGVEVDQDLVRLAEVTINLQQKQVELYHQDSLRPLLIDPVEVVVCDCPVGYYTDEDNAKAFQLAPQDGKAYSHYLLIEQALHYTKPSGYLMFIVPNDLFQSDEDKKLHEFLYEESYILALLQLPISLFKDPIHAKSILILQKKGPEAHQPEQVLLADLPDFTNQSSLSNIIQQIDDWFMDYHKKES